MCISDRLYHWRVLPILVRAFSVVLEKTLGVGGAVGMSTAANVFVGMVEAPLLISPDVYKRQKEHHEGDEQQESQCAKNHVVGEQIAGCAPQAEIIGKRDLATGTGSLSVVLGADKAKIALPAAIRRLMLDA